MSPSYSQPSGNLGHISGNGHLYCEKDLSRSYPSYLSSGSTYTSTVERGTSDSVYNGRLSPDMVTDGHTSLSLAHHSAIQESSKRTDHSQKLQRVSSDEVDNELNDIGYPGVIGIKNHGNTCYASSVIQCLSNTEYFTEHFVNDHHRAHLVAAKQSGRQCTITDALAQLIESLWTRTYTSKLSRALLKAVKQNTELFAESNGHDAEEFLMWLLNTVNDELYGPLKQDEPKQVAVLLVFIFYDMLLLAKSIENLQSHRGRNWNMQRTARIQEFLPQAYCNAQ